MDNALYKIIPRNLDAARPRPEELIDERFVRTLDEVGHIRAVRPVR